MSKTQERIKLIKENEEVMFDLYVKLGQYKFLEMLGIPSGNATHILGEEGLNWYSRRDEVRRKREDIKYNNWLDLNSSDTWYFIGYFLGDGHLSQRHENSYRVNVWSKDEYPIKIFAERFNVELKIVKNSREEGYCFDVYSQSIYNTLYEVGMRPRKSFEGCRVQEPPTECIGSFLRGLMDSDGTCRFNGTKEVAWYGHPSYMSLVSELLASLNIRNTQHLRSDGLCRVSVYDKESLEELFYKLYPSEDCIKLERKYQRYKKWLTEFLDKKNTPRGNEAVIKKIKANEENMFDLFVKLGRRKFLEMFNIPEGSANAILGKEGLNWGSRRQVAQRIREDQRYNNWLDLNKYETWYFVGFFLGKGNLNDSCKNSYGIEVCSKEEFPLRTFAARFNVELKTKSGKKDGDYYFFRFKSYSVYSTLYNVGIRPRKTTEGCSLKKPPTECICSFLRGLLDSHGQVHFAKSKWVLFTCHPRYANCVAEMLTSLNINFTQRTSRTGSVILGIYSSESLEELFYKLYPSEDCLKSQSKYEMYEQWMCSKSNIESVDFTDENMEMMDMEVEDTHNFYANGILVLNCAQELRLPAILCSEPLYLIPFSKDEDVHRHTAEVIWGKENYDKSKRKLAKVFNFSLQYGGNAYTLQQKLHISDINECQKLYDMYMKATSTLHAWQNYQVKKAKALGYVKTYFGFERRVKHYLDSPDPKMRSFGRRTVANTLIQTTGAYCTKLCMCKLWNQLLDPKLRFDSLGNPIKDDYGKSPIPGVSEPSGCRFMSTIHDEVNLSIPYVDENTGDVTERSLQRFNNYLTIFHHCMKLQLKGWPIPLDVGVSLGTTQGTMFDIEMDFNPDGSFKSWVPKWDIVEAPKEEVKEVQQKKVEEIPEFLL